MNNLHAPPIQLSDHKSLDHLIELDSFTSSALDHSSYIQVKTPNSRLLRLWILILDH